ncbi:MAG: glycosyltransferase family 2 protein [Lachnospiraceae bacterium]
MDILISIVVPVYNTKEYLEKCVYSIMNQTYSNLEILLIDDGSTDDTGLLCDALAQKDARIKVFHVENGGTSRARNIGIELAQGEYIGFVDSDDFIDIDMYQTLMFGIEKFNAMIAQVGRDEFHEDQTRLPDVCMPIDEATFICSNDFRKELLMHRGDCSFCTKLVHKELFRTSKFPEGELNEDFKLLIYLLEKVDGIVYMPLQAYHVLYRMGSNTRKKTGFSRVFLDNVVNADMVDELVQKKYKELSTISTRFGFVQRLDYLLHIPIEEMKNDNTSYRGVVVHVRKNYKKFMSNPYLTTKQKLYLVLLGFMPRFTRRLHSFTMRMRGYR